MKAKAHQWPQRLWLFYALLLVLLPLWFDSGLGLSLLSQIGIAIIVCLSYNILLGQGGLLSFGHAVYVGAGAFVAIHTLKHGGAGLALPVSLIPLVGGLGSLIVALPLGWLSTRKTATPFAMITFGLGELVWAVSLMFPAVFGGEAGVSANRVVGATPLGLSYGPPLALYRLIAAYTFICTALMYAFTRTPLGGLLQAARDNPQRLAFMGYDAKKVRYLAFLVAAFFAGVAGGLSALHFEVVSSEVFSASRSGAYLVFTFLGGAAFFWGPVLGAAALVLASVLLSEFTQAWLLYLGLIFLGMVMYAPGGLAGLIVRHVQVVQAGYARRLWLPYLALLLSAGLALLGAVALIEMLYHLPLQTELGPELTLVQLTLHTQRASTWLGVALLLLMGLALWVLSRRWWAQRWQSCGALHPAAQAAPTAPGQAA